VIRHLPFGPDQAKAVVRVNERQMQRTLLAMLVERDDRTQEEVVEGFQRCARQHGENATISLRTLHRWMSGEVLTAPRPAQRRVARLFWGHSMAELLAPAPNGPSPSRPPPALPVRGGVTTPDEECAPTAGTRDAGFDVSILERQVTMSTRRAARFTTFAERHNVGPETVDQLRDAVSVLANDYIREPLVTVIGDLIETQEAIFRLLEGKQKPARTRDLYLLAGIASGLLAKASHDLGRPHDAMTQARTMYVCADNADHAPLRAWARGLQSLIAYWAGRPQEAVRYAQSGAEVATDLRGSVATWLPALEARAWALLANPQEATTAVQRAQDRRDHHQADDLDEIGGLLVFPQAKQHYYAAGAYVFLADGAAHAETEATAAIELYETGDPTLRSFSDEAGAHAELALSRVHRGELEGARDAVAPVLELSPDKRIGGIVSSTLRIHEALRAHTYATSPTARDLREQIETFSQLPAAALPA
jgi:hypothetical protein